MEITNACDYHCPICFSSADDNSPAWFLAPDQVEIRAQRFKKAGGKFLTLFGGEPSLHPELCDIIRIIRKLGLYAILATNGLSISRRPDLLKKWRQAGLKKIQLQFDTFSQKTFAAMRGRSSLAEKFEAIEAVRSSGLRLGLVTTVTSLNLGELGKILDYAASIMPALNSALFQSVVPVGRVPEWIEGTIDRETIIDALVSGARTIRLHPDDFFPTPAYEPWQIAPHPDCEAHAFLVRDPNAGGTVSLASIMDLEKFGRLMSLHRGRRTVLQVWGFPLLALYKACLPGAFGMVCRSLLGFFSPHRCLPSMSVMAGAHMWHFTDADRLAGCSSCMIMSETLESVCRCICAVAGRMKR